MLGLLNMRQGIVSTSILDCTWIAFTEELCTDYCILLSAVRIQRKLRRRCLGYPTLRHVAKHLNIASRIGTMLVFQELFYLYQFNQTMQGTQLRWLISVNESTTRLRSVILTSLMFNYISQRYDIAPTARIASLKYRRPQVKYSVSTYAIIEE